MDKQLWERRENESSKAFDAFGRYMRMLPKARSLEKVREELGKSKGYYSLLERWSSKYEWGKRVAAHDDDLAAVREEGNRDDIRKMDERQAQQGMALQTVGLHSFMEEDPTTGKLTLKKNMLMKNGTAIRAIDVGTKIERTARGEPTEIIKHDGELTIKDVSDEELWRRAQQKGEQT